MPDVLAIVSKAVFEKQPVALRDVWPVDRYNSNSKPLERLKDGGRIFLVTVRPPNEQLWFLGVVESPKLEGNAWVSASKNTLPVTDITLLRPTIRFETGTGMSQDKGTLGMSLQTPRTLTPTDVGHILTLVTKKPGSTTLPSATARSKLAPANARVIGGKYEVLGKLGKGGMGTVYEARHTGTGRRVAVKEVNEVSGGEGQTSAAAQMVERFQREARATATIDSQHIALVLDSGTDEGTHHPFLVMELLKGEDLQQLLARLGPLPEELALRIAAQAALGLLRAHEAGVVHRDIKPANIFLARRDADVCVKLLDFGIARVKEQLQSAENPALTTTGLMLGTPLYMSPEQALGPKNIDQRSDLWSLGVVLYEMLTGHTPHDVETVGALILAICTKPARQVREIASHVGEKTAAVVHKLLAIDKNQRYASAGALLDELKTTLGPLGLEESMLVGLPDSDRVRVDKARQRLEVAETILKEE